MNGVNNMVLKLEENKYTNKEGVEKTSYTFKMQDLPVNEEVRFVKVNTEYDLSGESKFGKWHLAKGVKYGDNYVSVFLSPYQYETYLQLPVGDFTLKRSPVEKEFTITDSNGKSKKIKKFVGEYTFKSLNEGFKVEDSKKEETQAIDPATIEKYMKFYKTHKKSYKDVLKFANGTTVAISQMIDEASFNEMMKKED